MGQYYRTVNLKTMEWLHSHDYGSFLKLTEHSWIGNNFVGAAMTLLTFGNRWYKSPIVWAGDYYGDRGKEIDYYDKVEDEKQLKDIKSMTEKRQLKAILVNHTKKQYVLYNQVKDNDGWRKNPLPILTALGNGRGGGDYSSNNPDFDKVGIWARDILSIEFSIPKEYEQLKVDFYEE